MDKETADRVLEAARRGSRNNFMNKFFRDTTLEAVLMECILIDQEVPLQTSEEEGKAQ